MVCACGDDVAIKFRRGIKVVVVIIQPRLRQLLRLIWRQHTQRHAGF
ncbi:Uncharacterised protein [Vibrio cholerae]|nr:Uncharacterised protein [Vibrio cholerae]CSC79055.1 Uncharacterised protein [Vibrio cholerae]CSI08634.1 Uncharacterised protein [Vibrio cholerae]